MAKKLAEAKESFLRKHEEERKIWEKAWPFQDDEYMDTNDSTYWEEFRKTERAKLLQEDY